MARRSAESGTGQRWHVERTHARQNAFYRLARCYERRTTVIDAFFDLAGHHHRAQSDPAGMDHTAGTPVLDAAHD